MQITITQDFGNAEDAAAFLARIATPVPPATVPGHLADKPDEVVKGEAKAARKPRADAGKTREPYGPRTTTTGEPASAGPVNADTVETSSAPATPTTIAAPAVQQRGETASSAPTAATSAAEDFPATLDGARLAMAALNNTKGKGMDACIAALKANGVNRISDLPKEKYADFIKYVLEQASAEGIAEAKKPKAKAK